MSDKTIKAEARALYKALCALDTDEAQRAELRAAGVPTHRIELLYPSGFDGIADGLRLLLQDAKFSHVAGEEFAAKLQARLQNLNLIEDPSLVWEFETQKRTLSSQGKRTLEFEELISQKVETASPFPSVFAKVFASLIFRAWWTMSRRAELQATGQQVDEYMIWVVEVLLPQLRANSMLESS